MSLAGAPIARPQIILWELAGRDADLRFSPYCWRTRLALAHKGLAFETHPWRFGDPAPEPASGPAQVPTLRDGERVVIDSWAIAEYLDGAYPDRPRLNAGPHSRFINAWADTILDPAISRLIASDISPLLTEASAAYFVTALEQAFGMTLAEATADREERVAAFRALLAPVRRMLRTQPWLGGAAPDYADDVLGGTLMWPRCVSRFALLAGDDPVSEWFARLGRLFGGLLETAPRAAA